MHESGRCDVRVEEYKGVASNGLAAFEGKISVRDGISREDRHSFVRETVTERNATPRNELFFDNFGILYTRLETCVSKCNTCQLQSRLIQRVPSFHSRPMNRESSILSSFRHGERRRGEKREMGPLRRSDSFALSTSHAYASITNHSRRVRKVNFFLGGEGNLFRRMRPSRRRPSPIFHFNRKFGLFASRFSSPRFPCQNTSVFVCFRIAIVAG